MRNYLVQGWRRLLHVHHGEFDGLSVQPPRRRRFLIIHNAMAGRQRGSISILEQVRILLAAGGASSVLELADGVASDRRLVAEALRTCAFDGVVAAGGDSTVRGVAQGLIGTDTPLGIIPLGTGNVLAAEMGLARTPRAIAACLLHGATIRTWPGLANNEPFLAMAGAGFDAEVLGRLDMAAKRRIGKLAYVRPVLAQLRQPPRRFEIVVDGQAHACSWAVVTKAARYAGSFLIARRQRLTTEGFRAFLVDAASRSAIASAALAVGFGCAEHHPLVKSIACRSACIPPDGRIPVQIDGEPIGLSPLTISLSRDPLWLIAPAPYAGAQPKQEEAGSAPA